MDINTLPELEIVSDEEPNNHVDNSYNNNTNLDRIKPASPSKNSNTIENSGEKENDAMEEELLVVEDKEGGTNQTRKSEIFEKNYFL